MSLADDVAAEVERIRHQHFRAWEPLTPASAGFRHPACVITVAHPRHEMLRHPGQTCQGWRREW